MERNKIKKILILRQEHVGDYALSLPALRDIRENFPKAEISIVVGPWNEELAKSTPYVDHVIVFRNPLVQRDITYIQLFKNSLSNSKIIIQFLRKLNRSKYELLINFSDRKFNRLIDFFISVPNKILGTSTSSFKGKEKKRIDLLLKWNNIISSKKEIRLISSKKDEELVNKLIMRGTNFVLHPITPLRIKNWPLINWKELIEKILSKKKVNLLIIGTSDEKKVIDQNILAKIDKKYREHVKNVCGLTNLVQTSLLIAKSNLLICGDSGPLHLAEITKTPILALFGQDNTEKWGPYRVGDKIINKTKIEDISVDEVVKKIKW